MAGWDNDIAYAKNADFTGSATVTESNGLFTDKQIWVGSTVANAGGTHVNVLTLTQGPGVSILQAATTLTIGLTGGSSAIETITPNSGISVVPDGSGNVSILGTGSITTVGSLNTETIQLTGLTNHAVLVGAGTATISKVGPTATAGQVLQSAGSLSDPSFSTATYPSVATGTGKILRADGTNWVVTTATFPNTAGTSGNVLTSDGTNWNSTAPSVGIISINGDSGSATGSTVTIKTGNATDNSGSSISFTNSGSSSILNVTDASNNTIIGHGSGNATLSGDSNQGFGQGVFTALTTGRLNTALGTNALHALTIGDENVAVGNAALINSQSDNFNVAIGYNSLNTLNGGSQNTAVGYNNLGSITTGKFNTTIGQSSGSAYTGSESSNLLIRSNGVNGESNTIRIGNPGSGDDTQSSCFIAGITGITVTGTAVLCSTTGQLGTVASSERYKENIKDLNESISISSLRPVEFNYKSDKNKKIQYGLIAEEIHIDFPYLCFYNQNGDPESVKYHELPVLLLKEIQRLEKRVSFLESKF